MTSLDAWDTHTSHIIPMLNAIYIMMRLEVKSIPYISPYYFTLSFMFYFSNNCYKPIDFFSGLYYN